MMVQISLNQSDSYLFELSQFHVLIAISIRLYNTQVFSQHDFRICCISLLLLLVFFLFPDPDLFTPLSSSNVGERAIHPWPLFHKLFFNLIDRI